MVTLRLQVMELGASRLNFDQFKPEKEKLFVLISITLNTDSVAPKVHLNLVSCVNDM